MRLETLLFMRKISCAKLSLKRRKSLKLLEKSKELLKPKNQYIGDRFIGHRGAMNFDKLADSYLDGCAVNDVSCYDKSMTISNMVDKVMMPTKTRFIKHNMNQKTPTSTEKLKSFLKMREARRKQPKLPNDVEVPEKVFDSKMEYVDHPEYICADWSRNGYVALGFEKVIIVWDETTGCSVVVCEYDETSATHFTCLKWLQRRVPSAVQTLAIANSLGSLEIWQMNQMYSKIQDNQAFVFCEKQIINIIDTKIDNIEKRILSITFNDYTLSLGSVSGRVVHYDVRQSSSMIAVSHFHKKEIIQMKWSMDWKYLAVGDRGGIVSIWHVNCLSGSPKTYFEEDCEINSLAWQPQMYGSLLAFPAGSESKHIKIVDVETQKCSVSVNCNNPVRGLYWSPIKKQIVVVCPNEEFTTYQFRDEEFLEQVKEIQYSEEVQSGAMSPNGERMVAITRFGEIHIWKFFTIDRPNKGPRLNV